MNFTVGQGTDLALSKLFSSQGLLALHAETKAMCFQSWNIQNYFSLIDRAPSERQFRLIITDLVLFFSYSTNARVCLPFTQKQKT